MSEVCTRGVPCELDFLSNKDSGSNPLSIARFILYGALGHLVGNRLSDFYFAILPIARYCTLQVARPQFADYLSCHQVDDGHSDCECQEFSDRCIARLDTSECHQSETSAADPMCACNLAESMRYTGRTPVYFPFEETSDPPGVRCRLLHRPRMVPHDPSHAHVHVHVGPHTRRCRCPVQHAHALVACTTPLTSRGCHRYAMWPRWQTRA